MNAIAQNKNKLSIYGSSCPFETSQITSWFLNNGSGRGESVQPIDIFVRSAAKTVTFVFTVNRYFEH